ncbi:Bacterial type II secretion system protein F domain protein [Candidatus Bealeia paramacronuclearis]|uniref:Bacterial type II secretion system protein F domain protein n=1 Tax=Candidatus Bealeia paramacronuclearis TaxID=1921001 RepID=A0ABZ2C7W8_9PROT|nr:Bacterial type II secretion system protein F domain protein [Candidatus Bealeia paramacronuclearis]
MNDNIINLLSFLLPISSFLLVVVFWYFRFQKVAVKDEQLWMRRLKSVKSEVLGGEESLSAILHNDKSGLEKSLERIFQSKLIRVNDLNHWLKRTGYDISPVSFFGSVLILLIVSFALLVEVYSVEFYYAAPISVSVSLFLVYSVCSYLIGRRKAQFLNLFPNALDMIRRSLRAGQTPSRAMEIVASDVDAPVGPVFRFIVDRLTLGGTLEDALGEAFSRLDINDFHFLAIVMILQKETGGSLAEAVENLSNLLRERSKMRLKIKALSSEGKAGGYILTALPFVFVGIIYSVHPDYLDPLFSTQTGHTLLMIAGALICMGIVVINRIIKMDV